MVTCLCCLKSPLPKRRFCEVHKIPANRPIGYVPPPQGGKATDPNQWFLYRYGITVEDRDAMIEAQGDVCAGCKDRPAQVVDHDHDTGVVRGILCRRCNGAMVAFDHPDLFDRLVAYKATA